MNPIHTLIISPKYRPYQDGLSDYVFFFVNQLRKDNIKINLVTSSDEKIKEFSRNDHDVYPIIENWDFLGPIKLMKFIIKKNPQNILIEYVPQMYGRAGLNLFFPYYVLVMRFIFRKKIILMAHELYYPFQKNIKTGILFCWHIWNLFLLSIASDRVLTTTENFIKILRRFPVENKKIHLLPVGPNIRREIISMVDGNVKNLILFGSLHPSKNTPFVLATLCNYFKNNVNHPFQVHIIGATKEEIFPIMQIIKSDDHHHLFNKITFYGKLQEKEVAEVFSRGHYSINFFLDGITCRRGSAISALNLGLPIITNYTDRSDSIFLNLPSVFLIGDDKEEFYQCLKKLESITNIEYDNLRLKAFSFIDDNFSWEKICQLYLKYII